MQRRPLVARGADSVFPPLDGRAARAREYSANGGTSSIGECLRPGRRPFEVWTAANRPVVAPIGAGPAANLPPLRILMAEDSPDNCTITLAYLEDTPYLVDVAETGAIACRMFTQGHYDLVLMDRQMPVMDGLTATRTIRAWEKTNDRLPTPIIALTASALKGDRETCLAAGCMAYLTKPIKQDVLLQAIVDFSKVAAVPAPNSSAGRSSRGARTRRSPTGPRLFWSTAGRTSSPCGTPWIVTTTRRCW
jgi:CheY-like chemotaxis protein